MLRDCRPAEEGRLSRWEFRPYTCRADATTTRCRRAPFCCCRRERRCRHERSIARIGSKALKRQRRCAAQNRAFRKNARSARSHLNKRIARRFVLTEVLRLMYSVSVLRSDSTFALGFSDTLWGQPYTVESIFVVTFSACSTHVINPLKTPFQSPVSPDRIIRPTFVDLSGPMSKS